jgi:hypothetical protein
VQKPGSWFRERHDEIKSREEVARIVAEESAKHQDIRVWHFGEFVEQVVFPYYSGNGKPRRGEAR